MNTTVREGQKVVAGRIGSIREIAGGRMTQVTVKVGRNPEDWVSVRLTDRRDGSPGHRTRFKRFGEVGRYVVFVCNEVVHEDRDNVLWAVYMELGPRTQISNDGSDRVAVDKTV